MAFICDADLQHLTPGKKVMLKSYQGSTNAPQGVEPHRNYWILIGSKAYVADYKNQSLINSARSNQVLITFERDITTNGLIGDFENALWVDIADLKFVCRA